MQVISSDGAATTIWRGTGGSSTTAYLHGVNAVGITIDDITLEIETYSGNPHTGDMWLIQCEGSTTGFTVQNCILTNAGRGIQFHGTDSSGYLIDNNEIYGNEYGIAFDNPASGTISNNDFHDNNFSGIQHFNPTTNTQTITGNSFTDDARIAELKCNVTMNDNLINSTSYGLILGSNKTFNLEDNWWGAAGGPGSSGAVGIVPNGNTYDATPWYIDSGLTGKSPVIGSTGYESIAAAVSAASSGNTINLAGIYYEKVYINNLSLTLQGDGMNSTIIDIQQNSSGFEHNNNYAVLKATSSTGDKTINIYDLTLKNSGSNDSYGAIYMNNGCQGTIERVYMDCYENGSNSLYRPLEFGTNGTVNIQESVIDGGAQFGWFTNFMGSVSININECNFLNMGSANLWNQSSGSIDAERNWWGDTDPSDNVNGSNIDYTPWYLDSDRSPIIISSTLAADNSYLDFVMIEGCYSTDAGSGNLAASDFQVANFAQNGGGCSGISITSVSHTAGNSTLRCNLSSTGFASGIETFEIMPASASSIYDEDGNGMSGSQTSGTMTLNSQRPILSDLSVNSLNTSATLTFNQEVYANSDITGDLQNSDFSVSVSGGNATLNSSNVSHTAGSDTAIFSISLNGSANGAETLTIEPANASSIYNSAGGAMLASQTISDDLNDLLAPTVSGYVPVDNLTGVGLGADLELTFVEDVQAGSGNIVIKQSSDNSTFESIAAGSGQVTYTGNTVTINPSVNLDPSTGYYVNIDSGAIEDLNGNGYTGISGNSTWNFETMGEPVRNLTQSTYHLTIQDAVDNASAGDVIDCVSETYEEQVVIDIDLTLQGSGASDCIIRAPASLNTVEIYETNYGYAVLANPASGTINVKVSGFHIDANEQYSTSTRFSGIIFNDVYDDTFDAGIYNCLVDNMGSGANNAGITIFGESKLTVDNNTVEDYSYRAIAYYSDSVIANALVKFTNNTITGTLSKSKTGFYIIRTDNFVLSGNTISNCNETSAGALWIYGCSDGTISSNIISNSYYGIALYESSDGNEISSNTCTDCSYSGALISDSDNTDFSSNTIISTIDVPCGVQFVGESAGNTLDQNTFTLPYSGSELLRCIQVNGTVGANNVISNNTLTGGRRGIQVDASFTGPLTISGNTIQNDGVDSGVKAGLWVDGGEFFVSENTFSGVVRNIEISGYVVMDIKGNTIDPDGGAAYELINIGSGTSTSSDIEINYNNFENFSCNAVNNRASGLTIDFENNWFDGKLPASYVSGAGTTDYTPWISAAVEAWGMINTTTATSVGETDATITATLTGANAANYLECFVYGSKTGLVMKYSGERYPTGYNARSAIIWGCEETGSVTGNLDFDMTGITEITTLGNSILMCRDDANDGSWEAVAGASRNGSIWSVNGVTAFKEYAIGYDKAFNYAGLVNDNNTNTITVSVLSLDDVSGQVTCGGGVSGGPNQLTWYWGDGESSSSFFNANHTYSNTSQNYLGEVVASWNDGTPSVATEFVIRFIDVTISSPISIPTNLTVTIPSSSTFLTNTRLGSGNTSYDPFSSSYFTANTITRTNIEYVLGVAAVVEKELANNDIISISPPGFNAGFPQVLLRNGEAGSGMSSLWYTNPVGFIAGDDAINGSSISWSSFFHEMGHNFSLNSPADYWFGGKTDGPANTLLSETLAQIFQFAAGYEIVNGDYGLDEALRDEIRTSLESSFLTLKSFASDYESYCSWNDPGTPDDETLETFMKLAYIFMEKVETATGSDYDADAYKIPVQRLMSVLQQFDEELHAAYLPNTNSFSGATFRSTFMIAAISYAVDTDLRAEFSSLGFPVSDYWYERLVDNTATPPIEEEEEVTENSTAPVPLPAANLALAFTGSHAATTINAMRFSCQPSTYGNLPDGIMTVSSERYWRIASSAGNVGTFDMDFDLSGMTIYNLYDLTILRRNNYTSEWEDLEDLPGVTKNFNGNVIEFTGIPYFSSGRDEAVSEYVPAGGENTLLPVTLAAFTATLQENIPVLLWTTMSENGNSGWNIYRNIEENVNNSQKINPEIIEGAGSSSNATDYRFEDQYETVPEQKYYYWLESISYSGDTDKYGPITLIIPSEDNGQSPDVPLAYGLLGNYPNPFNPQTTISFCMEEPGKVRIDIFNLKGQKIRDLYFSDIDDEEVDQVINVVWDGNDNHGRLVSSGIYFTVMRYGGKVENSKMILLK